jgi:hypothetical protein
MVKTCRNGFVAAKKMLIESVFIRLLDEGSIVLALFSYR